MEKEEKERIEAVFTQRMINIEVKYDTKTFHKLQAEFFCGAMTALNEKETNPHWTICIQSGRPIVKPYKI